MSRGSLYDKEKAFMDLFDNKLKKYLTHVDCYGMMQPKTNKYIEFPLWTNKKDPYLYRLQFLFRVAYMYEEGLSLIFYPKQNDAVDFFGNRLELTDDEKHICQVTKACYEFAIAELERIINGIQYTGSPFAYGGSPWVYCSWMDVEDDDR